MLSLIGSMISSEPPDPPLDSMNIYIYTYVLYTNDVVAFIF